MSRSIQDWLSGISEDLDDPPRKRQKLSRDNTHRARSNSDPTIYGHVLTPPSQSPEFVDVAQNTQLIHAEQNMSETNRQMLPPPSPHITSSGTRPQSDNVSNFSKSTGRASGDQVDSSSYRRRILRVNNVFVRRHTETIPSSILQMWCSIKAQAQSNTLPTSAADIESLHNTMYERVEKMDFAETNAQSLWTKHNLFPADDLLRGLAQTDRMPFNKAGLPRSKKPFIPTISKPFPDLAYGYNEVLFPSMEMAMQFEDPIYQPSNGLFFPFLVIEVKSQVMGGNLWQATNQCGGGGSLCVNAITHLQDRDQRSNVATLEPSENEPNPRPDSPVLRPSEDNPGSSQDTDGLLPSPTAFPGTAFSLAIDTEFARLHVHWREPPTSTPTPNPYLSSSEEQKPKFFLQPIDSYDVWKPEDLVRLRGHLNAIVEWGMGERLTELKEMLERVAAKESRKRRWIESLG